MELRRCITPFIIQCFVSAGVTLNMSGMGLVMGFSTVLLPQLQKPDSIIQIDESSGSWIASIPGIAIIVGNFMVATLMNKFGRKIANLISVTITIIGWLCIIFSNTTSMMIAARFFQGIAMGIITTLGPILIGEYTSPRNRGAFLMSISISISTGVFLIHILGIYLDWRTTSIACIGIALVDILIVILSPESPSWLANQGKYEECRKVFRYLRGDNEEEELEKMIEANVISKQENKIKTSANDTIAARIDIIVHYWKKLVKDRAFYVPVFIMLHVYTMAQWSGVNVFTSYLIDLIEHVSGSVDHMDMIIISIDVQRIVTSTIGIILIKKIRRRLLVFVSVGLNFVMYLIIAGYTYAKQNDWLPYHHPYIGLVLIHLHMFSIGIGALPISFVLSGEIYPLEYKGISGGISTIFMSLNIFTNVKTIPMLFNAMGFSETYLMYSVIIGYCLVIVCLLLPETKDRTLLEIEESFRRKKVNRP
ncbi:facilitated trehalose transporter Tret1-like [Galleria mellonella]|uniref:Facilitated trehalose transporter Tret1-like n=1 Tax=Galleria mellonella TaxID=7137 RepID=A0ABM3MNY3_GALME|nr:facilitated trehalose transporter Tret1-like [Galleria mellonella]